MKVYTWNGFRHDAKVEGNRSAQTREIVAAKSLAEVIRITGLTRGYLTNYGSTTVNPEDVAAAMQEPGVVFWAPLNGPHRRDYHRAED